MEKLDARKAHGVFAVTGYDERSLQGLLGTDLFEAVRLREGF